MRLSLTLLISGLLLAAVPAYAAEEGFYLGAGVGQVNTEVDDVLGSGFTFDEDDVGYKLFGGYKFFSWLSVEGAYMDGGNPAIKASDADETLRLGIEVKSFVAAAVFTLPIGDRFELFAKPGIAYWDSTTSVSYTSPTFSDEFHEDDSGSAFFIGAGGAFNFTENFGVRLEYEWFDVAPKYDNDSEEFVDELDATAGFLSASFVYSF